MATFTERLDHFRRERGRIHTIVLSILMVTHIDGTAILTLQKLYKDLKKDNNINFVITNAAGPVYGHFVTNFPEQKCLLMTVDDAVEKVCGSHPSAPLLAPQPADAPTKEPVVPTRKRLFSE